MALVIRSEKYTGHCLQSDLPQCMHPNCPDFDLCSGCEALPIPVHPLSHPMLKVRTSDTVIPTVHRVGQTKMIDEPASQKSVSVCGGSGSPALLPPSPLATPTKSPELRPVVVSGQATNVTAEDQMPSAEEFLSPLGSPASEVLGATPSVTIAPPHLLVDVADPPGSPPSMHPLDIYHQLWPKVNQEIMHLNAVEALKAVGSESVVAEESLSGSPATSVHQPGERHGTCPGSPVPSTRSIVDGYRTPPSNVQESHFITEQSTIGHQQEIVTTNSPRQSSLDSVLVGDTNVPDGQIFPPGAEFVKGWHMMNNGGVPWPTTTEVQFIAGEMFAPECSATLRAKVGSVDPGQDLDIWTRDLKVCAHPR